jgi:acyl transferase domain-containing protein/NADPH:quinone reductase-like Zn-dependent oxidoreductase/acyl carrier protein
MSVTDRFEGDDGIALVGWACRFPGASTVSEFWKLLQEARCTIGQLPTDRFSLEHFGHPRKGERGRSYTWAAGVLDDIWGFDPGVFGISPREAHQMDPQQRILLQLTWEALEDAGIRPSTLAGQEVGVFVGGSLSEYAQPMYGDPSIADTHFATGNAFAVLANRLSHVFDLRGPSITIDTACSSSLVALHQAAESLRSGRVDTAIVGGINILAAPTSYISFSQASMLSPTGRCRAFSADADGYVRGEGGAVVVLRRASLARQLQNPVHGFIVASDVNSDGRTSGISLPSQKAQEQLLRRIYGSGQVLADKLAFVEAHGTGTPAGDPIEAHALGIALGRRRTKPLSIGSVKTNIGHLEPASGLAGVIKSLLALNHGVLPPSLNFTEPNPGIDFDGLNLAICNKARPLLEADENLAGVNSFGFGGTNAHVVLAAGRVPAQPEATDRSDGFFMCSAYNRQALAGMAERYLLQLDGQPDAAAAQVAAAAACRRDRLGTRLVVTTTATEQVSAALNAFVRGQEHVHLAVGEAVAHDMPVAFVFSGNGSQFSGMGRAAYWRNTDFRARFDQIDVEFERLAGWSLRVAMHDDKLDNMLPLASVAQPLIFSIQSAAAFALKVSGLRPHVVLGHSVGEVAAAEAAGIIDLRQAVQVIYSRSRHQDSVRNSGRMAAVLAPLDTVRQLVEDLPDIEIAALNAPRACTIAGPPEAFAHFMRLAKKNGIPCLDLDLDYPFHTRLMEPVRLPLMSDLAELRPVEADIPFVSSVFPEGLPPSSLDANYWWRNVRDPVHFEAAVRKAAQLGARYFVEVGPRAVLTRHINDILAGESESFATACVFERSSTEHCDPIEKAVAKALVAGARIDESRIFGSDPGAAIELPLYPWQQKHFRYEATSEAIGRFEGDCHPLAGMRNDADALEWHGRLDTSMLPALADHRLGEQVILPGTGFLEIAMSVARQWLGADQITLTDFETLVPLDLTGGHGVEVMTRVSPGSKTFEISSRPRLSRANWTLHARGKVVQGSCSGESRYTSGPHVDRELTPEQLYDIAHKSGLRYGPAFSLVRKVTVVDDGRIDVELVAAEHGSSFLIDPMRLDCCSHGLIALFPALRTQERGVAYIPIRVDETALCRVPHSLQRAIIRVRSRNERSIYVDMDVFDQDDALAIRLRGIRCQAVHVRRPASLEAAAFIETTRPIDGSVIGEAGLPLGATDIIACARRSFPVAAGDTQSERATFLEGWATVTAHTIVTALAKDNILDLDLLVTSRRIPAELIGWLQNILTRLATAGLAKPGAHDWTILSDPTLPNAASILTELMAKFPEGAADLLLASEMMRIADAIVIQRSITDDAVMRLAQASFDFAQLTRNAEPAGSLMEFLSSIPDIRPDHRLARVLQLGHGQLTKQLKEQESWINLTVFEPDHRFIERAISTLARSANARVVDQVPTGPFDLIVAADGLGRARAAVLPRLCQALAPRGILLALEPRPSMFTDLVFGFIHDADGYGVAVSNNGGEDFASELRAVGFKAIETAPVLCGAEVKDLVVARAPAAEIQRLSREFPSQIRIWSCPDPQVHQCADILSRRLQSSYAGDVVVVGNHDRKDGLMPGQPLVYFVPAAFEDEASADLVTKCLAIKEVVEQASPSSLWLVFRGAVAVPNEAVRPVLTGVWAFARTLANEHPHMDVRRIDLVHALPIEMAMDCLSDLILSGTSETELQVRLDGMRTVRVSGIEAATRLSLPPATSVKLERRVTGSQRVAWQSAERAKPNVREVEIEVAATGVNFRDLMLSIGLLPDDILEDGYSGPMLGLECAGTVVGKGSAVDNLHVGDRVVTLASQAFSTHVVVPAQLAARVPKGMSFEAAATIPVAYITAYYALVELARLQRGERILIHSGAGAVGIAAIQIARMLDARVIATAGSEAKRSFVRSLGVEHVLDSRTIGFVDDVRRLTETGVDVVLNSLAGEAMERGMACLQPFGRFIELGKRDFVANSHIGVRPFRRNLSYFGVDIDQLISGRPEQGRQIFSDVMDRIATGALTPLPYSVFPANAVTDAFHAMQQSLHVGKLVVRPPESGQVRKAPQSFRVASDRVHVVVGGAGGFGLSAARWLVDRGACNVIIVGRQGARSQDALSFIHESVRRGLNVSARACDVADPMQVERLFAEIERDMPPLAGIIHSAMVLDDTVIANLNAQRFDEVVAPKVRGADNLDRCTRHLPLDYFVLFSSMVTLIGNRGQGSYVAANAYLEGLARRRRQEGLPALAIGWGPIEDVGVVARSERMRTDVRKIGGLRPMKSDEALDLMAQALSLPGDLVELAAITIAPNDGALSADLLPILKSPTYEVLRMPHRGAATAAGEQIDVRQILTGGDLESARDQIAQIVTRQLAGVLLLREEDVVRTRPLAEMGLDSLMALELAMNLEDIFGIKVPLSGSRGELTVASLSEEIITLVSSDLQGDDETSAIAIAEHHLELVESGQIEVVTELLRDERRKLEVLQ